MYGNLAILGTFVFLYSIISGGLEKTPINGALVFTGFGLLVGPLGLDLLTGDVDQRDSAPWQRLPWHYCCSRMPPLRILTNSSVSNRFPCVCC